MYRINDVVQFTKNHKWCGSFGIIDGIKEFSNGDVRYMIGVPIPKQKYQFIFSMEVDHDFEYIGRAVVALPHDEDRDNE